MKDRKEGEKWWATYYFVLDVPREGHHRVLSVDGFHRVGGISVS